MIHHKGTNPRTGRGVSQRHPGVPSQLPNLYSSGTNPRTGHWTACLCPVKDVADVTVEPPQENRERGKRGVQFLSTCGAAQGKQSAAALTQFDPQVSLSGVFPAAGHNGRHPKNWLSGDPSVQRAVQAAGTNLKDTAFDEVGASAVANAQTPQSGNVGPLDDLSAGPFTERAALWLHGYFHARARGAHCTQRGHGNRRSNFLYGYQHRFDGGFTMMMRRIERPVVR